MIWLWLYVTICLFIAFLFLIRHSTADYSDAIIGTFAFLMIAAFLAAVAIAVPLTARHGESVCARLGTELERDTRFVRYSSFSWECITPSEDGWVSMDRVIKAES